MINNKNARQMPYPFTCRTDEYCDLRSTGHAWVLHLMTSRDLPWQGLPPFCAGGLSHFRTRDWIPEPHVNEHKDVLQLPQLPSMAEKETRNILPMFNSMALL